MLTLMLLPAIALAGPPGTLVVGVHDQHGEELPGAVVEVLDTAHRAETNGEGLLGIRNLEAGVYTVTIAHEDYPTLTVREVQIWEGRSSVLVKTLWPEMPLEQIPRMPIADGNYPPSPPLHASIPEGKPYPAASVTVLCGGEQPAPQRRWWQRRR